MKSFRSFMTEGYYDEATPSLIPASMSMEEYQIQDINRKLELLMDQDFLTPYIAFTKIRRCLVNYGISVQETFFLENEEGEVAIPLTYYLDIYGKTMSEIEMEASQLEKDMKDEYYLYFAYSTNEEGFLECWAEIVDGEDLEDIYDGKYGDLDESVERMKSNLYGVVRSSDHTIIHKGSAKSARSLSKKLNKENPNSHYVGITHKKKMNDKFK